MAKIDTGDTVVYTTNGTFWVVAFREAERFVFCGWPLSTAPVDHCELHRKASPSKRLYVLHELARLNDRRGDYARAELSRASDPD